MERPNILLIMCDQMRQDMLGCYGNPVVQTPNVDRLARSGVRCLRNYVANPICMPNRLSILSGMNIRSHGLWTNGLNLPHEVPCLSHHLSAAGYQCATFGKMHLRPMGGDSVQPECQAAWDKGHYDATWTGPYWGFEHVELMLGHSSAAGGRGHYNAWFQEHGGTDALRQITHDESRNGCGVLAHDSSLHDSTFIGERTAEWLRKERDPERPFFAWASFPDPHSPFLEPADMAHRYDDADIPLPIGDESDNETRPPHYRAHIEGRWHRSGTTQQAASGRDRRADLATMRRRRAVNYTECELIDRNVGRILQALEETGLADNTIVIFTADHGELFGDHGHWQKGPFFYEGLINTPLIVRAPGMTPAGSTAEGMVSDLDIAPTLYELCGIDIPVGVTGMSQAALLRDPALRLRQESLVEYRTGYGPADVASMVLVTDEEKYVHYSTGDCELTLLAEDPEERRNVASEHPDRAAEMRTRLLDHMLRTQTAHPEQICHA